jgi:AcrR family transcriptional regulator
MLAVYPLVVAARRKQKGQVRPGGHPLRQEVVFHHQRQRILQGAAKVIAQKGYRNTSVADLVSAAAVSRKAFYANFGSKEDCFLSLYASATSSALGAVEEACRTADGTFPERVEAGIGAFLAFLEANPELAHACVVEGPAVGPAVGDRFEQAISGFASLLRAGRERGSGGSELPASVEETVVGGLYWMLYYALLERRPKKLARLLPQLAEFSLIPFAGSESLGATTITP